MQGNGKVLRQRRVELGLSQADLAKRAKTSQAFISQLETERKKLAPVAVRRILTVLGLELKAGRRR
jgi:predicted transcriptional regulator